MSNDYQSELRKEDFFSSNYKSFVRKITLNLDSIQSSIALSPDGYTLVTGGESDRTVRIWSIYTGQQVRVWMVGPLDSSRDINRIYSLAWSSDGKILATGGSLIQTWEIESARKLRTFKGGGWGDKISISSNGIFLVTEDGKKIVVWNLQNGKKIRIQSNEPTFSFVISPNSEILAAIQGTDAFIKMWNLNTGEVFYTINSSERSIRVRKLIMSSNGQLLAGGGFDGIKIWNLATGNLAQTIDKFKNVNFHKHLDNITSLTFSPNGQNILSSGGDGLVQVWDVNTGKNIYTFEGLHKVSSLEISQNGHTLVTHSKREQSIEIWRFSQEETVVKKSECI